MGPNPPLQFSCEVYTDHIGALYIIGPAQKLLYKLSSTLTDPHRTQSPIACVTVRAKDHAAAPSHHLSIICMDDSQVRWYIYTAVFFRSGERKHMVVLIDCPTYRTKGIMAGCHDIRDGKFLYPARTGRLNNSNVGNVVRCQRIKPEAQIRISTLPVVSVNYGGCNCAFPCFPSGDIPSQRLFQSHGRVRTVRNDF